MTALYIQLDQALLRDKSNEIHVGTVKASKEIKALREIVFDTSVRKKACRFSGNVDEQLVCDCLL
jgi:hypothetical protein